jgi:periplasmic protein TonB
MAAINNWRFNPENKKNLFILLGFVMGLSLVYIVLEWSKANKIYAQNPVGWNLNEPVEILPITTSDIPLPPPPPKNVISDIITVVPDDVPIETTVIQKQETTTGGDEKGTVVDINAPVRMTDEIIDALPIVDYADEMPEFNGNVFEYLSKHIRYPQVAVEEGIHGRVYCQFVVNRDGTIVDIKVLTPVHSSLDNEALRVISGMPKWKPGKQNGRTVRVRFILPVNFRLM